MTEKLYYKDAYSKEIEAEVVAVSGSSIILDKTIFYPEGGGQPGDSGWFNGIRIIDTQKGEDEVPLHILEKGSAVPEVGTKGKLVLALFVSAVIDEKAEGEVSGTADPSAQLITQVHGITEEIRRLAGGEGSALATGGMRTKLHAAEICGANGCDMVIANGAKPELLYDIVAGRPVGTRFLARPSDC